MTPIERERWNQIHDNGWEHAKAAAGAPDAPAVGPVLALECLDHTLVRLAETLEGIERILESIHYRQSKGT